ncbi:MAG: single-stranded-DNA-specific exonuclease RecJ [Gammaproteobacteria bacterium]|nr:single-stranded-DNA-specific exonuclease RecJ [Gammaproteobacteria bacterium]
MTAGARRIVRRSTAGAPALPASIHPLLRRIYAGRDVRSATQLDYRLANLASYTSLGGMDGAVALLERAIDAGQRILVVSDYDADGATGCALAVRGLRLLGATDVAFLVPNRFEHGYGLTPELVENAAGLAPDVIVTVDNGITSLAGVDAARRHGIEVLITDHHLPGAELPAAAAIVNPNLPGDAFVSKHLAGVGVVFYVLLALRARLRQRGRAADVRMADLLDLVALGTVADVVRLDHNNRVLVAHGLARIRTGRCVPGISALVELAGRERDRLAAADLAFAIAPRLNAAGRVADMRLGIDCLLSDDPGTARSLAAGLDTLNRERRARQAQMQVQADGMLAGAFPEQDPPAALCLYRHDWHPGIVGVLAARIRERTGRPVVAFAGSDGATLRGSARSVAGLNVRDAIAAVATRLPQVVLGFGGHAMAAGLTITAAGQVEFATGFAAQVERMLGPDAGTDVIVTDGALDAADFTLATAELLAAGGPWGAGFPEPSFDTVFDVTDRKVVGAAHLRLDLRPDGASRAVKGIGFGLAERCDADCGDRVRAVFRLAVDEYGGRRALQLVLEHIERTGGAAPSA